MEKSDTEKVQDYLEILTSFTGTSRTGMEGYHDYYEQAGYAVTKIEMMGDRAIEGLIISLDNPNAKVRREAIRLLGQIGGRQAVDPLTAQLQVESDQQNRKLIMQTLHPFQSVTAIQAIASSLKSDDWQIRKQAVARLGEHEQYAITYLINALYDPHDAVRRQALNVIRSHFPQERDLVDALVEVVDFDANIALRQDALKILAKHKYFDSLPIVYNLIEHDPPDQLWDSLLFALNESPDERAIPIALHHLQHTQYKAQATRLLLACSQKGLIDDQTLDSIIIWMNTALSTEALSNYHPSLLVLMCQVLVNSQSPKAVAPIQKLIHANIEKYSQQAVQSLVRLEDDDAVQAVRSLFTHPDEAMRIAVLTALSKHPLRETLDDLQAYQAQTELSRQEAYHVQQALDATKRKLSR